MIGRPHLSTATVASNATATPPMPHRMRMPRRSRLLRGTASALRLPLFSSELLADVLLELAEVEIAASDLRGAQALHGGVVLPGQLAEVLHRALVGAGQPLLVLRDAGGGPGGIPIEVDGVGEIGRSGGDADAQVRLAIPLEHDVARVLQL